MAKYIYFICILFFLFTHNFAYAQCLPGGKKELEKYIHTQFIQKGSLNSKTPRNTTCLVFFSTWCADCKAELLELNIEQNSGHNYILINTFDSLGRAEGILKKMGIKLPCIYDSNNALAKEYKVRFIPQKIAVTDAMILHQ